MPVDTMKMTITVPAQLHRRFKAATAMKSTTASDVVREAIEDYVADAMEEAAIRAILEVDEDIAAGREKVHKWDDVKTELRRKREERIATRSK